MRVIKTFFQFLQNLSELFQGKSQAKMTLADAARVSNEDWWINAFLQSQGNDVDVAYAVILECLRWRHNFDVDSRHFIVENWITITIIVENFRYFTSFVETSIGSEGDVPAWSRLVQEPYLWVIFLFKNFIISSLRQSRSLLCFRRNFILIFIRRNRAKDNFISVWINLANFNGSSEEHEFNQLFTFWLERHYMDTCGSQLLLFINMTNMAAKNMVSLSSCFWYFLSFILFNFNDFCTIFYSTTFSVFQHVQIYSPRSEVLLPERCQRYRHLRKSIDSERFLEGRQHFSFSTILSRDIVFR